VRGRERRGRDRPPNILAKKRPWLSPRGERYELATTRLMQTLSISGVRAVYVTRIFTKLSIIRGELLIISLRASGRQSAVGRPKTPAHATRSLAYLLNGV